MAGRDEEQMARQNAQQIRTSGAPACTAGCLEVMAFHLHRFLSGWMEQRRVPRLHITVGFEGSALSPTTFVVERRRAEVVEVGWTFEDLCHTYKHADGRLRVERAGQGGQHVTYEALPILDRPALGGAARVVLGFLLMEEGVAGLDAEQQAALQVHVYEAICAARRNSLRLFFDEHRSLEIKALLYAFMERLPGWTGCDYAATLMLTSNLEAMTLEDRGGSVFNVLAERVYFAEHEAPERLVGMTIGAGDGLGGLLGAVYARQRQDADLPYQLYARASAPDEPARWRPVEASDGDGAGAGEPIAGFHRCARRVGEGLMAFVPLIAQDADGAELLGFLALTYRQALELPSSIGQILDEMSEHLAPLLRHSSLYTLSARKLWLLRQLRQIVEHTVARGEGEMSTRVEGLIGEVSALIGAHVAVPSFGIAYMLPVAERGGRVVRYVHTRGFDALELVIDVPPDRRHETGVSSLSVRLGMPLVLAGGHAAGEQGVSFKNSLYVHEDSRRLLDVRAQTGVQLQEEPGWAPLSLYYKPVRKSAYATLAYPITFCDEALGILSIEVDKDTNWLWWTGFGGHLFWQLVASELSSAFYALGVRGGITA
jgi:hypothetical protein